MTRDERKRQSSAAIALCEKVGPRLKALGEPATLSDAQLANAFAGVELRAATWLCYVAQRCELGSKRGKDLA